MDTMTNLREYVTTSFGTIAYSQAGTGPAAVLLHGWPLNGDQWRHQLAALSDLRRVIAPDALGLGHTQIAPDQRLGAATQADGLAAFLDALGLDTVDLVGNDSGAGAAQIFAARHPHRVRTLTVTNGEVHDYDEDSPAQQRLRRAVQTGTLQKLLAQAATDPEAGRHAIAVAYADAGRLSVEALRAYFEPFADPARIELAIRYLAATTNLDTIAVADLLATMPAPTMVLWGTDDDFFPLKLAYWLRDHLPHVEEVSEVDGGRTFWPEEQPAFLNQKLRDFWTRHPA
jgi:pimeloyl-ACP methyl ester carboxylesterase